MAHAFTEDDAFKLMGKQVRLKKDMYAASAGDIGTVLNFARYGEGYAVQVFWYPELPASPLHSDYFLADDFADLLETLP